MGYSNKSLNKPIVGICYTESGFNNCHRNFPEILESLKNGVLSNGALPIIFPMISLGETFKPNLYDVQKFNVNVC